MLQHRTTLRSDVCDRYDIERGYLTIAGNEGVIVGEAEAAAEAGGDEHAGFSYAPRGPVEDID
jgi:hypothetical protein